MTAKHTLDRDVPTVVPAIPRWMLDRGDFLLAQVRSTTERIYELHAELDETVRELTDLEKRQSSMAEAACQGMGVVDADEYFDSLRDLCGTTEAWDLLLAAGVINS